MCIYIFPLFVGIMAEQLVSMFQTMINIDEKPCDVSLISRDGCQIKAHRDILIKCSFYFNTVFNTDPTNSEAFIVHFLPSIDTKCLQSIVSFAYNENFEETDCNVFDLLSSADFLQMPLLMQKCKEYITGRLNTETWINIWRQVKLYSLHDVEDAVMRHLQLNFDEIVYEGQIYELDFDELIEIVIKNKISTDFKRNTCIHAFCRWIDHARSHRLPYVIERAANLSPDLQALVKTVCQQFLVM